MLVSGMKSVVATLLLTMACLMHSAAGPTCAVANPIPGGIPNLEQTLRKGLRPRGPAEDEFLLRVVRKVDAGRLPLSMVQSTFLWARKNHPNKPFRYFERGLRLRAEQAGISI